MKCTFCHTEMYQEVEYEDNEMRRTVYRCPKISCNIKRDIELERMRKELDDVIF